MITTEKLLPLLAKAYGLPVDLISEEVQDDGQVLVAWSRRLPPGEMRFGRDPPLLISSDRETLKWAHGQPANSFTLKDLQEADPADEANRHPLTKALALRLRDRLQTVDLVSPTGAAALVVALTGMHMCIESTAALAASATGQNFWELMKHALFSHRYRRHGSGSLPAPYSIEEDAAARLIVSEPWFTEALQRDCQSTVRGLYLPVVANENAGVF